MPEFEHRYRGARVLVTGHTGFTGGWLCSWLTMIGAQVSGMALAPEGPRNLFGPLGLADRVSSTIADINEAAKVEAVFERERPEIVFHLAAQPIVSRGYDDPRGTFMTNVMGTLNVLEAARRCSATRAVVCVTTDKVYRNNEWAYGYRETDPLGGKDPYSASKAASEAVIATYQQTLAPRGNGIAIAAARGGNIIGGGDFAHDRIVPDFVRAAEEGTAIRLRNPTATRPWQHVMALAHGYLVLADRLCRDPSAAGAWNFGPGAEANRTVGELVAMLGRHWTDIGIEHVEGSFPEAHFLRLSSEKANSELGWHPPLTFADTAKLTAEWYRSFLDDPSTARAVTDAQLAAYRAALAANPRTVDETGLDRHVG